MEFIAIFVVGALFALAWVFAVSRLRVRAMQRGLRREKLEGVVEGHLEMAEAHAGSLEELRPQALAHRQAAADHTRKAEELGAAHRVAGAPRPIPRGARRRDAARVRARLMSRGLSP